MQSLILSAEIVIPLFLLLGLGWLLHKHGVLSDSTLSEVNNLCFKVLLPVTLFLNVYSAPLSDLKNPKLILFALGCQVLILLLLLLIIPHIERDNASRASMIQGMFRINFVIFGFSIVSSVGNSQANGAVSLLAAVLIPFFNIGSIVVLEHYRGGNGSPGKIAVSMLKNPFVQAFLFALAFALTGIRLPEIILKALGEVNKMSTPTSLIALGGCINFASAKTYRKQITIGVVGRLVVIPALLLPVCIAAGFRGGELLALIVMLISPTAVASYNMARTMDANAELSGHLVVFQSTCSIITIFLWLWLLGALGYL